MEESQDGAMFKRDIASAIRESNGMFAKSMEQMSSSASLLAQRMNRSMEAFSRGATIITVFYVTSSQGELSRILSQQN